MLESPACASTECTLSVRAQHIRSLFNWNIPRLGRNLICCREIRPNENSSLSITEKYKEQLSVLRTLWNYHLGSTAFLAKQIKSFRRWHLWTECLCAKLQHYGMIPLEFFLLWWRVTLTDSTILNSSWLQQIAWSSIGLTHSASFCSVWDKPIACNCKHLNCQRVCLAETCVWWFADRRVSEKNATSPEFSAQNLTESQSWTFSRTTS